MRQHSTQEEEEDGSVPDGKTLENPVEARWGWHGGGQQQAASGQQQAKTFQ